MRTLGVAAACGWWYLVLLATASVAVAAEGGVCSPGSEKVRCVASPKPLARG